MKTQYIHKRMLVRSWPATLQTVPRGYADGNVRKTAE